MTRQQELSIELIRLSRHNDLDGPIVAEDIISNR